MKYCWFPKRTVFSPDNYPLVVRAFACPDQRKYRRLTYAERLLFESAKIE